MQEVGGEDVEAQRSLAAGGYVGVRRLVRLLDSGDAAKRAVDDAVDRCAQLINLRVAIMKYRCAMDACFYDLAL